MINNRKKALIHVAKKQLGLSEDEYRAVLEQVGVGSSKDLTDKTFGVVMAHFERLGFKPRTKKRPMLDNLPSGKQAMMKKLEAILLDLGLDWGYVDSQAKKSFGVEKTIWLDQKQLHSLLKRMIIHQNRTKTKLSKRKIK